MFKFFIRIAKIGTLFKQTIDTEETSILYLAYFAIEKFSDRYLS